MNERQNYFEDVEKQATSNWHMDTPSDISISSESSQKIYQDQNQDLQLSQKKELPSARPSIPATKPERLSYYRTYAAAANKTQIICMQHITFNRFLWYYVTNVIFKSLPHTFVHIFLASYAPEEHLFLSKMTPFFYGVKYSLIFAGFWDVIIYLDLNIYLMDYVVSGILFKNPWNRCDQSSYYDESANITVNCYTFEEFVKKFENSTPKFDKIAYFSHNESFQVSQIEYYGYNYGANRDKKNIEFVYYCIFILLFTTVVHKQVYRRKFWKILHILQWIVNGIDFLSFVYLTMKYFQAIFDNLPPIQVPFHDVSVTIWTADIDILAESTTAPPIVHVLTARSIQQIKPTRDSAMMVLSNALCYVFRGWLIHRVKKYCENLAKTPIYSSHFNSHSWFYFWPMYFSTFYLGNIYTLVFLTCNFVTELLSITVTYHCFVEVILCEWQCLKDWMVTIVFLILGVILFFILDSEIRFLVYIYIKSAITLTEVLLLYLVYPLGRLVDDITFHYGIPPTKMRIYSLNVVPIFYTIKIVMLIYTIFKVIQTIGLPKSQNTIWSCGAVFGPLFLGVIYVIYRYIVKQKKSWRDLFVPDCTWGPRDFRARQFRKQYNSRTFIGSQAPRMLGRYLINKSESKSYRLDIRYDPNRRSTTTHLPTQT